MRANKIRDRSYLIRLHIKLSPLAQLFRHQHALWTTATSQQPRGLGDVRLCRRNTMQIIGVPKIYSNFYFDKFLNQSLYFTEMTQKIIGQSQSRTNFGNKNLLFVNKRKLQKDKH